MQLSIQRRDEDQVVVLELAGELDTASAPALEHSIREAFEGGHDVVQLDLHRLDFVDSAGVSTLIRAREEAGAAGRVLVLRRPTSQVHTLFALVGLAHWLSFEDEEQRAAGT